MTQGILNPVDFRSLLPLLPAEQRLVECLREGKQCKIGDGGLPTRPIEPGGPGASMPGNAPNVIRGEVIRYFALGGGEQAQARGSEITLGGAWIQGEISLLNESTPYALSFAKCHFDAPIELVNAECRSLHIHDSRLAQGLFGDGLRMAGGMFLRNVLCVKGGIRLVGAQIGGNLEFLGGEFQNPNGYALVAANAKVGGSLIWRVISGDGVVNLAYAKAGVLADDLASWKPFKVVLDGFAYDQFAGLTSPTDAKPRIEWLANRPSKLPGGIPLPFSPLPYEQAAKVLFGMGHDNDAWEILLEKERIRMRQEKESGGTFSPVAHEAAANVLFAMGRGREARDILWEKERLQTKDKRTPLLHKIGRRLWDVSAGYGYRLRRTAAWMAFFVLTGTSVFLNADLQGRIVPHQGAVLASATYQSAARQGERPTRSVPREFPGHPEFNQFWFSLDLFIPLFNLHQETYWAPDASGGNFVAWFGNLRLWLGEILQGDMEPFNWRSSHWWFLTLWYWVEIVAGWILTSLFVLSVTGVLRPRQSSGEKG